MGRWERTVVRKKSFAMEQINESVFLPFVTVTIKLFSIFIQKTKFLVKYNFTYYGFHINPVSSCALLCYNVTQKHSHLYVIKSQCFISRE